MASPTTALVESATGLQVLTQSRLHAFRKCRRYHKLRYLDGWRATQVSEALSFGTMMHAQIEAYWRGTAFPAIDSEDKFMVARVAEMLRAYAIYGWPDRDDYEVLAVEHPVRWPLLNPETMHPSRVYEQAAVVDLVLRRKATGEVILVEHKSTAADFSDDAAPYWDRLAMDSQLSIYVVACEALGYKVDRIIYDVVARPQLKPALATPMEARKYTKSGPEHGRLYANQREHDETADEYRRRLRADIEERPARYCGRREIARLESEIRDGMLDTWDEAKAMRAAEVSGRHPRNPDACHQYSTCEFFPVCAYGVEPSQSTMFRKTENVHEELVRHERA